MKKICVIGSLNVDLVANLKNFHMPGETVVARDFKNFFGGKGANQCVALTKLGANIGFVGKVGDDGLGEDYIQYLKKLSLNTDSISREKNCSTGTAIIEVDEVGENRIIIVPGANEHLDCDYIKSNKDFILDHEIFLLQIEIPFETIEYLLKILKENNKTIILDPAPARFLSDEMLKDIDYITPNETELEILTGSTIETEEDLIEQTRILLNKGVKNIIAKAGKNGAYVINRNIFQKLDAYKVSTIDTTAAGDSFNGGFAYYLSKSNDILACTRFASAVAALSTTAEGAQLAMPTLDEVNNFLLSNN